MKKLALLSILLFTLLASAAGAFQMRSGYYVGNASDRSITGIGITPDLVIIKADTSTGRAVWRSSSMAGDSTAYFERFDVGNQSGLITSLNAGGFSIGTGQDVNYQNVRYTWVAFSGIGADFKVGSYTGTGADDRNVTGIGFQPNLVWIKRDGTSNGVWYSSAMGADQTHYFSAAAPLNNRIQSLIADGFQVGDDAEVNLTDRIYHYVAFKAAAGSMTTESYTVGASTWDNRLITIEGFNPDFVFVKRSSAANQAVLRSNQSYGDEAQYFTATNNAVNVVQTFEANGFQVGTDNTVNAVSSTYYFAAFRGIPAPTPTGTFKMISGSYLSTGQSRSITGLGFRPDLVMIKADNANFGIFTTSMMDRDSTASFATNVANVSNGITSIDNDGFTIGTSANPTVNTAGITYRWVAFTGTDSTNFKVGAYTGIGTVDNRPISGIGFTPDFVAVKGNTTQLGVFRTSSIAGDNTAFFSATVDTANVIQALETDGFQVGTGAQVNTAAVTYYYFAFKNTAGQCTVDAYTGDNVDNRSISSLGFRPGMVWIKRPEVTTGAVLRSNNLAGDNAQYFLNTANTSNLIQALEADGFQIGGAGGTSTAVNAAGVNYRFAAWKASSTQLAVTAQPTSAIAGAAISPAVTVAVKDADGNTDTTDNTTNITIAIDTNPSSGTLSGTLTKMAVSGVATFNDLSIDKAGVGYTLLASATGRSSSTSTAFDITPAAANKLTFTAQPSQATIGTIITPEVKVEVQDTFGNPITSDNTTEVTMSIGTNPGGGTLAGTLTKTASAGVSTFSDLNINRAGAGYTLLAAAAGLNSATSDAFTVINRSLIVSFSPTRDAINVPTGAQAVINFSREMNRSTVENAFTLKVIADNSGATFEPISITGTTSWDASGMIFYFTPSSLNKGYTYRAALAATAQSADLATLEAGESWDFTVTYDHTKSNTIYSADRLAKITLGAGTIPTDGTAKINRSPRTAPDYIDPNKITAANDKVLAENNPFHYPLSASITEFNLIDSTGTRVTTTFAESATLALYYDGADPLIREKQLVLCRLDEVHSLWVKVPDSAVNETENFVHAPVHTLSVYTIMSTPALSAASVFAFPNPFKPSLGHTTVTFTNLPAICTIKVFTLSGDPVIALTENNGDGQYAWDVKNSAGQLLQSGVYLYIVSSGADSKTGKLAVIR